MGLYDVAPPQVAYPPHQAQFAIPHRDDRMVTKEKGLGPLLGPRHLGHDGANHEGVNNTAHDGLDHNCHDSQRALLGHAAEAIPNGCLCLH